MHSAWRARIRRRFDFIERKEMARSIHIQHTGLNLYYGTARPTPCWTVSVTATVDIYLLFSVCFYINHKYYTSSQRLEVKLAS